MTQTGEDNRFWQLTLLFAKHFTPRNSSEVEVMLQSKERRNHNPHHRRICVTCKREKQLEMFVVLKTVSFKPFQNL